MEKRVEERASNELAFLRLKKKGGAVSKNKTVVLLVKVCFVTGAMIFVAYVATRVFTLLAFAGFSAATVDLAERGGDGFRGYAVFHRACANAHLVFLSFYVLEFRSLADNIQAAYPASVNPGRYVIAMIAVSLVMLAFGNVAAHRAISGSEPRLGATGPERVNIVLALWGLVFVILFAW